MCDAADCDPGARDVNPQFYATDTYKSGAATPPAAPTIALMNGPSYENTDFLESDEARPVRILAEYLEPLERFRRAGIHDTVVFFGSARATSGSPLARYYDDARELARRITL